MTDTTTEVVVAPAAPDTPPNPAPPQAVEKPATNTEVEHTPGGWPVVPLAFSGANTTVSMVAAAGLAGGPIAAAVAATGAVVLGTVASYRNRNPRPKQAARRAAARTAGRSAAARNRPSSLGSGARAAGSAARRAAGGAGGVPGQKRSTSGGGGKAGHGRASGQGRPAAGKQRAPVSLNTAAGLKSRGAAGGLRGKASQVKALRSAQKAAGGSRGEKRAQTIAARRAVADARRNTTAPKPNSRSGLGKTRSRSGGLAGRMLGGAGRKARAMKAAAIAKNRARRDAKAAWTVASQRSNVRKAPARQAARKALRRSAARFHGRRALAALLALPIGLLGLLTSPLGRKLGLPWLVHPGRRLYRRLTAAARDQRADRDQVIRDEQTRAEQAAEEEAAKDVTDGLGERVQRPTELVPDNTGTSTSSEGEHVSGFRFEEHAAEMEQAAQSYDPEDAMEILAMVESLPAALTSVANVMKTLAERADSEFPLEKEVADGFNDIFGALMSAVAVAEDMGPLFRQAHEHDIARHEDPRNGPEAEKGWNV
ncbi:hypothetical protein [Streptomyces jeddahensis]|uniref:Uncharacterized protein n=1 Tax=Streptomyces jeddahensis TaxID=1716141 RepID=A0A177HL97_9ACTN|nr:hypothetical protein [Streptomyces jeddahensis]OAH11320.1 hypothetical protein STSP_52680 [Streptomyces jeddahensis]